VSPHRPLLLYAHIYLSQAASSSQLRRRDQNNANGSANGLVLRKKIEEQCTVLLAEVQFEDKIEREADVFCVLQGADLVGAVYNMVKVKGLPPGWAKNNNVVSAETFLLAPAADIDFAASELIIPDGADIQVNPFLYDISYTRLYKH
jgi:hypothetical protein